MEISIHTNFYNMFSLPEAIERLKKSGFTILDVAHDITKYGTKELQDIKRFCDKIGVKLYSFHAPMPLDIKERREELKSINEMVSLFEKCHILGVEVMVFHPFGYFGWDNKEEYEMIKEVNINYFNGILKEMERYKIKIAIENLGPQPIKLDKKSKRSFGSKIEDIEEIIRTIKKDGIGICIDTGHAIVAEEDVCKFIEKAKDKIFMTHIQDTFEGYKIDFHLFPFNGHIDWWKVMKTLKKVGYKSVINFEVPGETGWGKLDYPVELLDMKSKYAFFLGGFLINL